MKIKVVVELGQHELGFAPQVEHELREVVGKNGDVSLRHASSGKVVTALEIVRSANPSFAFEQLANNGQGGVDEIIAGLADLACGAVGDDDEASKLALTLVRDPTFQARLLPVLLRTISAVLADATTSRVVLRHASATFATLVGWDLIPLASAMRSCLVLLRLPDTVTAGTILAAVLTESFSASMKEHAESAELKRLLQPVANAAQYEYSYVADGLGWVSNVDATSVKRVVSRPVGEHPGSCSIAMAMAGGLVTTCSQDGLVLTFDINGNPSHDPIRLGAGRLPTALDISARPRQIYVATVLGNGRPYINVYSAERVEASSQNWWSDRLHIERTSGKLITAIRALRSGQHFCAAECGPADGCVLLFDQSRGTATQTYTAHEDVITSLHVPTSREHFFLSTSRDRTVALYDIRAPTKVGQLAVHSGTVSTVSTEGEVLVVGGFDGKITVCDLRSIGVPLGRKVFDSAVVRVAQGPNHLCAVSCASSLQLMSLHVAEMPTARVETVPKGRLPCADLAWIPGRSAFFGLFDASLDLLLCSPSA